MQPKFNRVILYARQYRANQDVMETVQRLLDLLPNMEVEVFTDLETAAHFVLDLPILPYKSMGEKQDVIIVVGGDGSLLAAAALAIKVQIPVIGINRGRLGFLTDITPQNIESSLGPVLAGKYIRERRFLLHACIYDQIDQKDTHFFGDALNDVVLGRGNAPHLVEFEVFINQQFVSRYHSDGMIIATPTGSTAYALSAGGPIMHPELNAIVIVPMFPHSLSSRPLVIDGDVKIDLKVSENNKNNLQISCDGHKTHIVKPGQLISITKNTEQLCLLHPLDYHYYDTLRIKLGWEVKQQEL